MVGGDYREFSIWERLGRARNGGFSQHTTNVIIIFSFFMSVLPFLSSGDFFMVKWRARRGNVGGIELSQVELYEKSESAGERVRRGVFVR